MTDLRKGAKGMPCQLRLPGVCSHNPDETVLCHIRRGGVGGMGLKPNDLIGIHACGPCHAKMDGRGGLEVVSDTYILEALCRTLDAVVREGLVKA